MNTTTTIGSYAKAIVAALLAALLTAATGLTGDGHLSLAEWLATAGALLGNLGGVWAVKNFPGNWRGYAKAVTAAALAGIGAAVAALPHLSTLDFVMIAVAALGTGFGVQVAPNAAYGDKERKMARAGL